LNNQLVHDFGRKLILAKLNEILSTITAHIQKGGANLQSAIATFHLNVTVMLFQFASNENVIANNQVIAEALLFFITWVSDLESTYRAYQALGNLISLPNNEIVVVQIKSVDVVVEKIRSQANNSELVSNGFEKLSQCAADIFNIIQK
jgi:phospholipase A-2-activating protein